MCFDLQASIRSSLTSAITCFILYTHNFHQNQRVHFIFQRLALFFAFVSLMQVYDWIFWTNLKENKTNYIFTKIAMISNHLQPLVLAFLINQVAPLSDTSALVLGMYSIYSLYYSLQIYNKIDYTLVSERSAPSLDWKWNSLDNSRLVYTLFVASFTFTCLNLPYPLNILMVFINIASFSFSSYTAKNTTGGELWCGITAYIPLLLLFVELIFKF